MSTMTLTTNGCSSLKNVEASVSVKKTTENKSRFMNQSQCYVMAAPMITNAIGQGIRSITSNWYGQNKLHNLLLIAEPGDLLEICRAGGFYSHWGVYAGQNELGEATVVHFSKQNLTLELLLTGAGIQLDGMLIVLGSGSVRVNNAFDGHYNPAISNEEMNDRIANFMPENERLGYDLLECNSEHFATYCRYGMRVSGQAKPWRSAMNGLKVVHEDGETSVLRLKQRTLETELKDVDSLFKLMGISSVFELIGVASIFMHAAACLILKPVTKNPLMFNLRQWTLLFGLIGGFSASKFIGLVVTIMCILVGVGFVLGYTDLHLAFEHLEELVEWELRGLVSVFALTGVASFLGLTGVASLFSVLSIATLFQVIGAYLVVLLCLLYVAFGVTSITTVCNQKNADILFEQEADNMRKRPILGLADVTAMFIQRETNEEFGLTKMVACFGIVSAVSIALLGHVIFSFGMNGAISVFGLIGATSFLGFTGFDSMVGLIGVVATFAMTNLTCVFGLIGLSCLVKKLKIGHGLDCTFLFYPVVLRSGVEWVMCLFLFVFGAMASHFELPGGCSACKVIHCLLQLTVFSQVIYISDPSEGKFLYFSVTAITVVAAIGLGKGTLRKLRQMQHELRVQQERFIQTKIAELKV